VRETEGVQCRNELKAMHSDIRGVHTDGVKTCLGSGHIPETERERKGPNIERHQDKSK